MTKKKILTRREMLVLAERIDTVTSLDEARGIVALVLDALVENVREIRALDPVAGAQAEARLLRKIARLRLVLDPED